MLFAVTLPFWSANKPDAARVAVALHPRAVVKPSPASLRKSRRVKESEKDILIVDVDECPHWRKIIKPFGFATAHINATMTHGRTKIIMPIGAVNAIIAVKIHGVGNIGEVIART